MLNKFSKLLITCSSLALIGCSQTEPNTETTFLNSAPITATAVIELSEITFNHPTCRNQVQPDGTVITTALPQTLEQVICDITGSLIEPDDSELFDLSIGLLVDTDDFVAESIKITENALIKAKTQFKKGDKQGMIKTILNRSAAVQKSLLARLDGRQKRKWAAFFEEINLNEAYGYSLLLRDANGESISIEVSVISYDDFRSEGLEAEHILESWPESWKKAHAAAKNKLQATVQNPQSQNEKEVAKEFQNLDESSNSYDTDIIFLASRL